ncbi:MAG: efflux RND transporter permease subunit, partial [Bacteroidetes bacterium]|nr:efflux RND transporter permease subunit [Bacteroidota bacterium]
VFFPAFFMSGIPKAMFLPLSLSVGFAMIASFILSQSFVPVIANWMFPHDEAKKFHESSRMQRFKEKHQERIRKLSAHGNLLVPAYLVVSIALAAVLFIGIGKELFPRVDAGQFQVRVRLPESTRLEKTEAQIKEVLAISDSLSGGKIAISSAFLGLQASSYPVNVIHLWTSGSEEGVLKVKFIQGAGIDLDGFRERLRHEVAKKMPDVHLSFEPADLVDQVMSQGGNTPIEIRILGKSLAQDRVFAKKIFTKLQQLTYLRDVSYGAPQGYPAMKIDFDRVRLGQMGLTVDDASKSLVAATSSSRFTEPVYWLDKSTGTAYQVQVQVPEFVMNDPAKVDNIPLATKNGKTIYMRDVATWRMANIEGEYDRLNQKRYITLTANLEGKALGQAINDIDKIISGAGKLPEGMKVQQQGQAEIFGQTFQELQNGLIIAIVVIFLLLAVNFQSFRLSLLIISVIPGIIAGSFLLLWLTGKTLNIQSYMGVIMAIGVAVANAILFVTQAERYRREREDDPHIKGIADRVRPILMTSLAMIAGMVPMALGLGEGGDQTSPLGTAVIGGLLFSMLSSLVILPLFYHSAIGNKPLPQLSLDPDDPASKYFETQEKGT